MKKFKRLMTLILALSMIATLFTAPTVADAAPPEGETYEEYDVVTYNDLLYYGNPLTASRMPLNGNPKFAYNRTSPTYSVIFKYRWTAGSYDTDKPYYVFYYDKWSGDAYPFALAVKSPNYSKLGAAAGANGAWHLDPSKADHIVQMSEPIVAGQNYDIEHGRLMVATGSNAGKYYVYVKVNDELIYGYYYSGANGDGTYGSNNQAFDPAYLRFTDGTSDNYISAVPEPETFEDYDEITFDDLYYNGNSVAGQTMGGKDPFTYNATSPSYSVKFKYRWIPGGDQLKFTTYFDAWKYPFCFAVKTPGQTGFGAQAGPNGSWHLVPSDDSLIVDMDEPIVAGQPYDIEVGRLKVRTGPNAGQYYVYYMVNGELIQSYYYNGVSNGTYSNGTALSNKIIISAPDGNVFSATPIPETYEDYDEITFDDLYIGSTSMAGQTHDGKGDYNYTATSPSYSVKFSYRWIPGGSDLKFTAWFDSSGQYPFCYAVKTPNQSDFGKTAGPNGSWHLVPSDASLIVDMDEPIVAGKSYDIEIGRLKVKTGSPVHVGKYYVYFKVGGELIQSYYYDGVSNGTYGNNISMTNRIKINAPSGNVFSAIPIPETYEDYDEITFDDLYIGSTSMAGQTKDDGNHTYTYNATSPSYSLKFKYRWTAGGSGENLRFSTYLDDWVFPFCFAAKYPGQTDFGAHAGANGAWHLVPNNDNLIVQMEEPVVSGQSYDIEIGRLKVRTGSSVNVGKYYVYFKVNDELIQSYYYGGVSNGIYGNGTALSNKIIIASPAGNAFSAIPIPETYDDYDEISYYDLKLNGDPVPAGGQNMSGATTFTYDRTSESGSAIFRFNWKTGDVPKMQLSFEKTSDSAMAYQFGAWLSEQGADAGFANGRMWLIPGSGPQVDMPSVLSANASYNVEFGRLKVATGTPANVGRYYLYVKINDTLIAEDYVASDVVDANGDYTSNPGSTACNVKSGEIFFAFWGSSGNAIGAVRELPVNTHTGIRGDLNNDAVITSADLTVLRSIMLGTAASDAAADFNNDAAVDLRDLIAMLKYLFPVNTYSRSGEPVLGMQEHLLEDSTKTVAYIADVTATMGAGIYRLGTQLSTLFDPTIMNGVTADSANLAKLQEMVAALKAQGIEEILFVSDDFVHPSGYLGTTHPGVSDRKTVPDPQAEPEDYQAWLEVNAAAYKALAEAVPEIRYFEPYNEINLTTTGMERPGVAWDAKPDSVHDPYRYSVQQKAGIMADLCWYVSKAVKSVDRANQVTTPSIATDNASIVQSTFLGVFYSEIKSGNYPTGKALGDVRIDNFFTIVNAHAYPEYSSSASTRQTNVNAMATRINNLYSAMLQNSDGGRRVWLTEVGVTDNKGSRPTSNTGDLMSKVLDKIDTDLTYIDALFIYKIADISASAGADDSETSYGLFYSGDAGSNRYNAKNSAQVVYSFFHNGSTDYSALDALVSRYRQ
ncbi:MAG: cellulase family glycosylhydrolase [Lachnospiraceae bacterium]|nr:cellulase family glycosylhydrolase [Lachnospiraceae bacterium]